MSITSDTSLLCNENESVLVIIDVQERLSTAIPEKVLKKISEKINLLSQAAALLNIPVMVSEQYPKGLGSTLSNITSSLPDNVLVKEKTCFSCASNPDFVTTLEALNKKQVILVGMEAHICVTQTALEFQSGNYQVFISEDAVCSRTKHNYKNALQRMLQAGCVITNSESICFEWLRDAKHSQFKEISNLIK